MTHYVERQVAATIAMLSLGGDLCSSEECPVIKLSTLCALSLGCTQDFTGSPISLVQTPPAQKQPVKH